MGVSPLSQKCWNNVFFFFFASIYNIPLVLSTTAHSCQATVQIHSPTLTLHSHIPFAINSTTDSLKLTSLPGQINWTAEASSRGACGFRDPKVSTKKAKDQGSQPQCTLKPPEVHSCHYNILLRIIICTPRVELQKIMTEHERTLAL